MIKAKKLDSVTALDVQVRRLYESAFPVEEQIPYEDLMVLMDKMPLDFYDRDLRDPLWWPQERPVPM